MSGSVDNTVWWEWNDNTKALWIDIAHVAAAPPESVAQLVGQYALKVKCLTLYESEYITPWIDDLLSFVFPKLLAIQIGTYCNNSNYTYSFSLDAERFPLLIRVGARRYFFDYNAKSLAEDNVKKIDAAITLELCLNRYFPKEVAKLISGTLVSMPSYQEWEWDDDDKDWITKEFEHLKKLKTK